jgi:uncharacterized metal-binding protein YceD (DUF177 family)
MKIEFKKITTLEKEFSFEKKNMKFFGEFFKDKEHLFNINAKITGETEFICDRCAKEFEKSLDIDVDVKVSDGIYSGDDDVIEMFSGELNFEDVLESELGLIKSDYHYCSDCEKLDNFEAEY